MAGPWFTVVESGADWTPLGHVWLSDGESSGPGFLEYRVTLEEPDEATASMLSKHKAVAGL